MQTIENLKCVDKTAEKTERQILRKQHRTKWQNPQAESSRGFNIQTNRYEES